jgi:cytosine/adenosine deaminase-related metal-dependent hydrolase
MLLVCLLAQTIAFVNVQVIPMNENRVLRNQVVLVEDGRIRAIGADVKIPEDAQRIDGENGYLIPGLIDLHTHLMHGSPQLFVANGVTTILTAGDGEPGLALRRQELAPSVFACGPSITNVKTSADAERIVEEQKKAGYDCIKIYDDIEPEALTALVDGARKRGMLSIGHIPRNLTWQQMLAAKPDAIAHLEEFLYSPVDVGDDWVIVGQMEHSDIAVITTLTCYDRITRQVADLDAEFQRPEVRYIAPDDLHEWERPRNRYRGMKISAIPNMRRLLAFQKGLAKKLHAAGVRVLAGTDGGGVPFVISGWSMSDELRQLVSAGLSPYDALRAATADAAKFIRRDDVGTIEVGKAANLVLLRGDPLRDIDNIDLRAGVMLRGRWLDQTAIRDLLNNAIALHAISAKPAMKSGRE